MTGWMTIAAMDNGFRVTGYYAVDSSDYERCADVYFDDFEDALDFIRECAGQAVDLEDDECFDPVAAGWWGYALDDYDEQPGSCD